LTVARLPKLPEEPKESRPADETGRLLKYLGRTRRCGLGSFSVGSRLIEHLGTKVGQGGPGDQNGGDDCKGAEDSQGKGQVAALDGVHHGCLISHGFSPC